MTAVEIQAQVIRYDVTKLSMARNAVPLVILVSIVGKYIGVYALGVAILFQAALAVLFIRARSNLGLQAIKAKGDSLIIPGVSQTVRRGAVTGWVLSGRRARVYGTQSSYRLTVPPAQQNELSALLTQALGRQLVTKRRGSSRARSVALAVAIAGAVAVAVGVGLTRELLAPALVGIVAVIVGGASFGALSQRVAVDSTPTE